MRLSEEEIDALATAGAAAPSGGNMQAWRLVAKDDALELSLDAERSTAFIDVDRSGSLMGLGSFVENVSVEASARGLSHEVEVLGLGELESPVVRVSFSERGEAGDGALSEALRARATNRKPWDGETLDEATMARLAEAARSVGEGFDLLSVCGDDKAAVADALAEADVVRTFHRPLREGMLSELRWTEEETKATLDGIDIETLELTSGDRKGLSMMRRAWFVTLFVSRGRVRSMTKAGLAASSHICAVTMPREASSEALVRAGRAVERVWLEATRAGVALQPWCVIPFFILRAERHPESFSDKERAAIASAEAKLRELWRVGADRRLAFVCRMSHAEPPSALALRRPWKDFTEVGEN